MGDWECGVRRRRTKQNSDQSWIAGCYEVGIKCIQNWKRFTSYMALHYRTMPAWNWRKIDGGRPILTWIYLVSDQSAIIDPFRDTLTIRVWMIPRWALVWRITQPISPSTMPERINRRFPPPSMRQILYHLC